MSALAATAVQMLGTARNQQIGIAVARQQGAVAEAVAGLVAEGPQSAAAGPSAPPGQGLSVDRRV